MKKAARYMIIIALGALVLGVIVAAVIAGKTSRDTLECRSLSVEILDSLENDFVSAKDIRQFLDRDPPGCGPP